MYLVQSGLNERIETTQWGNADEPRTFGTASISITHKVDVPDPIIFKLLRVTDGLDNSVSYALQTSTLLPPTSPTCSNFQLDKSDSWMVNGHASPGAFFNPGQDSKIMTYYDSQYQPSPSTSVSVQLEGSPPFKLTYEFVPKTDSPAQPSSINSHSNSAQLMTSEPGTFRLLLVSDGFCTGSIKSPITLQVEAVNPPTLTFKSSPIEEICFGAVGSSVDLSFTGQQPYWIEYSIERVRNGDRVILPRERQAFGKGRDTLILKPMEPGNYRYTFEKVLPLPDNRSVIKIMVMV